MADGKNSMVKLVVQLLVDAKAFAGELDTAAAAVKKMATEAAGDLSGVGADVSKTMEEAAADVSASMDSAAADVSTLTDGVEEDMKDVVGEIEATGDAMAEALGEGAAKAGDKIEEEIEEGAAEASRAIDEIPENSRDAFTRVGEEANTAGNRISRGMKRAAGDMNMSMREATHKVSADVSKMAAQIGTSMIAAGGAILGALALMAKGSREINNTLGELSTAGIQDLEAVKQAGMEFSNQWAGISAPQFIESAGAIKAAVAQLSDEAVISFAKAANLTAKATKSTADEMADLFGKAYAIFKPLAKEMSDVEWAEHFGGAMTAAANAFNTSGSEMASSIRSIGAAATSANVPLEEQLGILGTLQATMSGSEAGTLYKSFLTRAATAGEALNLSFTNANGTLKSTPEILKAIQQKFPDISKAAAQVELQKAFGAEGTKMIAQLIPQLDLLEQGISDVATGWERAGVETEESAQKMNTDKVALAAQRVENLKNQIGDLVFETFAPFLETMSQWVLHVQDWVKNNQPLVDTLVKLAAVIGVVLVVGGALLLVFAAAAGAVALFTSAAAATVGAGIAAIFTATGAIVAGIVAAVIAAAAAVIHYWDEIKWFFQMLWDEVKSITIIVWESIVNGIKAAWNAVVSFFSESWDFIKMLFSSAWEFITGVFTTAVSGIVALARSIVNAFTNGIRVLRDAWTSHIQYLRELWDGFWGKLKEGWEAAKAGPSQFAEWLVDAIRDAVERCKEFLMGLWSDIKALPGKLWDAVTGGGDGPAPAGGGTNAMTAGRAAASSRMPTPGGAASAMMGAAAGAAPGAAPGASGPVTNVREINLYQQPGQSPEELLKVMARELQFRRGGRA